MDKVVGLLIRIRIHMGPAVFQSTGHPASGGKGPSLERTVPHPVVQFRSGPSLFATLCDSRDFSTPGFLAHHQLRELAQTHVHSVSDVIQPSHPLSSPSLPAFTLSQHQGLVQWVSSSLQVNELLEFQLQHQSFQWIFRVDFLQDYWSDLLAVQWTLKSLLQHYSSKESINHTSMPFLLDLPSTPSIPPLKVFTEHQASCAL